MREWINQSKIDLLAKEIGEENVPILVNIFLGELNDYQSKLVRYGRGQTRVSQGNQPCAEKQCGQFWG